MMIDGRDGNGPQSPPPLPQPPPFSSSDVVNWPQAVMVMGFFATIIAVVWIIWG